MKFKESALAHHYLDGLRGLEIGGSAHNPFGLNTRNVDYTDSMDTIFKKAEIEICGEALPVDIVAHGEKLPLPDNSEDFIISSHVIEHIFDPISALKEWQRVIKPGGYIFTIVPIREMVPGENRPFTDLRELMDRYNGLLKPENVKMHEGQGITRQEGELSIEYTQEIVANHETGHFTVFSIDLFCQMAVMLSLSIKAIQANDDKVGNGFTVVLQKKL